MMVLSFISSNEATEIVLRWTQNSQHKDDYQVIKLEEAE